MMLKNELHNSSRTHDPFYRTVEYCRENEMMQPWQTPVFRFKGFVYSPYMQTYADVRW